MHHLGKVALEAAVGAAVGAAVKGGISAGIKATTTKSDRSRSRQVTPTNESRQPYAAVCTQANTEKLNKFSQKDLQASISFFNEGFLYLCKVIGEGSGVITERDEVKGISRKSKEKALPGSIKDHDIIPATALLEAIVRFKDFKEMDDSAAKALTDSKERFRDARKKATKAFWNEVLGDRERIFAARYRVFSTLLEKVDSPEDALGASELRLRELHALTAVKKGFEKNGGSQII